MNSTADGEIHTGNSELSIHNMADANISISQVTVTLGDNAVFSTSPAPSVDTSITVGHFGADSAIIDDPGGDRPGFRISLQSATPLTHSPSRL